MQNTKGKSVTKKQYFTINRIRSLPTASYKSNKTSNLSARDKASGLVNKYPESIVKIDKASKGIKSHAHMMTAANYIARNGKIDLEDESGLLIQKDELKKQNCCLV